MTLAEAIRKGATMHPQVRGRWAGENVFGEYGICALTAATLAVTGRIPSGAEESREVALELWPELRGLRGWWLVRRIIRRNDRLRWSREQIADWLDERDGVPAGLSPQATEKHP